MIARELEVKTMSRPQVYEGTAEEIATQLRESKLTGRFRAILVPENGVDGNGNQEAGETLLERLKGRVGRFDFGGVNLSEDTGRKFTELLVEKHRKEYGK
jgi:hypothetical protein